MSPGERIEWQTFENGAPGGYWHSDPPAEFTRQNHVHLLEVGIGIHVCYEPTAEGWAVKLHLDEEWREFHCETEQEARDKAAVLVMAVRAVWGHEDTRGWPPPDDGDGP